MELDVPQDFVANPSSMPRPYVTFETRSEETKTVEGATIYSDVVWAKVMAPGGKDVLDKKAEDWIAGLKQHAQAGRIPPQWPGEYEAALKAFKAGEELPPVGTPIKTWPPLSPAQRKAVLGANVLTVEDLAAANDEMKLRIGMGAQNLVTLAKTWLKDATGPGALAAQLEAALAANVALQEQVKELLARIPKDPPKEK